jgi:adenylate cyclase
LLVGIVIGGLLAKVRPQTAMLVGVLFAGATFVGACWWLFHTNVWYNWLVPVAVQTPIAIAWSLGANYFLEVRRRGQIRKAFSLYLSPHMADRIADEQFDLTPGGSIVEATVVFTDLEGFTALSEKLSDPAELAAVLIEYFSKTTGHVLASNGTLIKYIGDSVFAAWGAPLADPEHAAKAVLAAWRMHLSSEEVVQGHRLVTRVGINTGEVLAGNLGSKFRFDYTLIGDAVNFASRLEGLNKYLGTAVLLAESTVAKLGDRFTTRRLGEFIVVGKKLPVTIHELLGPAENRAALTWIETFAKALALFQSREFDAAGNLFRRTRDERNGADGPSQFYLEQIERLNKEGLPPDWNRAIEITAK